MRTLASGNFERIWLEPREGADPYIGRQWCQDNQWGEDGVEHVRADLAAPPPSPQMAATDDQREAWINGDMTGAYVGTEASKRLPLKVAPAEQLAALMESGQAFANQVRAVTYKLNGQAYSSTVSALNQFDADLRRIRAALAATSEGGE